MDLAEVLGELAEELASNIDKLNTYPFPADRVTPPAALFWPEDLAYDLTMGRGSDRITCSLWLAVGRVVDKAAWAALAEYVAGAGQRSVKAVLEGGTYTSCGSVRVTSCEFGELTVGSVAYLGARFTLDILGSGQGNGGS